MTDNLKIGYALSLSTPAGIIGGVLVTDEKGFPLEFQYTDPILPTKIQRILYGASLDKYLKVDVILDNLLKVLTNKVDFIIVEEDQMLEYDNSKADIVRIVPVNSADIKIEAEIQKNKENEYFMQFSKIRQPVRVQFQKNIEETDGLFIKISEAIKTVSKYIDVTEPQVRVSKSLDLILNKKADE